MKEHRDVVVVGAGLLGLSTASALQEAGYSVTVIDQASEVASGTSYANGGLLTPSMSEPWNAPGVHWQLLRYLGRSDAPMLMRISSLHNYIGWGLRFLANTSPERYRLATRANMALSQYSVNELGRVREKYSLEYLQATNGTLKIFRDASVFSEAQSYAKSFGEESPDFDIWNVEKVIANEPALKSVSRELVGGIFYAGDERGDARIFCQQLKASLEQRGVEISLGEKVERLLVEEGQVRGLVTESRELAVYQIVNCAGVWSPDLSKQTGTKLLIKPVKGYSVSATVADPTRLPKTAILDDAIHAAVVPLGDRVRLAGTAEFCGWNEAADPSRVENLWHILGQISPELLDVTDRASSEHWCGFRPMSADGCPYIGATAVSGLYVNTGHGPLGWTQASGSAALLVDIMQGKASDIDSELFSPAR